MVIYGAGGAGARVVREILSSSDIGMRPVGFIDDDASLAGKLCNAYPVLGALDQLDEVIAEHGVKGVVLATSKLPEARLRSAVRTCERKGIWMKQLRLDFEVKASGAAEEASYNLDIQW